MAGNKKMLKKTTLPAGKIKAPQSSLPALLQAWFSSFSTYPGAAMGAMLFALQQDRSVHLASHPIQNSPEEIHEKLCGDIFTSGQAKAARISEGMVLTGVPVRFEGTLAAILLLTHQASFVEAPDCLRRTEFYANSLELFLRATNAESGNKKLTEKAKAAPAIKQTNDGHGKAEIPATPDKHGKELDVLFARLLNTKHAEEPYPYFTIIGEVLASDQAVLFERSAFGLKAKSTFPKVIGNPPAGRYQLERKHLAKRLENHFFQAGFVVIGRSNAKDKIADLKLQTEFALFLDRANIEQIVCLFIRDNAGHANQILFYEFVEKENAPLANLVANTQHVDTQKGLLAALAANHYFSRQSAFARNFGQFRKNRTGQIALFAAGLGLLFLLYPARFEVLGEAILRGKQQQAVVAPKDGYIFKSSIQAGDIVEKGQLLVELDKRDLELELISNEAKLRQSEQRYKTALSRFEAAELRAAETEVAALRADIDYTKLLLSQTEIRAAQRSVVLTGDLKNRSGSSVRKGEELLILSPLTDFYVEASIAQRDLKYLQIGAKGNLKLIATPFQFFEVELQSINPIADDKNSNEGNFIVRADIIEHPESFRPGMKGLARFEAGRATRLWSYSRSLLHWLRLQLWRWTGV